MTDLVISEDVGKVPAALSNVGDSLSSVDMSQLSAGWQSPSLVAALWVTNDVLPQLNSTHATRIYTVGSSTDQAHRSLVNADQQGM